jgi:gliding motility-associated-like protein
MKKFMLIYMLFAQQIIFAQLPCGQNIDFNTWSQEGELTSGSWVVTNGGNSVEQNINGTATWFVSSNDFFNVIIQGSIQVNTAADDDLVGFVFGYQNPIGTLTTPSSTYVKTYFFDWNQTTQTFEGMTSNEGFALYEMDGLFDFTNVVTQGAGSVHPELWERANSPIIKVLDTNYGNNGWNDFQQYDFQLKYTADSIIIWIDNVKILEEHGCYEPGKFGFYNQSQDAVLYSNFSYNIEYDFNVSDTLFCVNDTAFFEIGSGCINYIPPSTTFNWDFGNNITMTGFNPSHVYTAPDTYNIELISDNNFGCKDTTNQIIQVFESPILNIGIDSTLCQGETLILDATTSNATYLWQDNSTNPTCNVTQQGSYWAEITVSNCSSSDTILVNYNPIPNINLGNDTTSCQDETLILDATTSNTAYLWQDNSTNPTFNVTQQGTYWVEVTVNNCSTADTITIQIEGCEIILEMPNVFSPNNDGKNDLFLPLKTQRISQATIRIYSRWGQKTLHSANILEGWNGRTTSGSIVPDGTYFWIVNYENLKGTNYKLTGFLTLLR